jgi:glycosyltransferase involved in cell wall biosynthesis
MTSILQLSYVISTRNRLPFLKRTLQFLLENIKNNEEIVVVDGNSTDGTKEYLAGLYADGKIHKFVSEPDKNQAHGWNKAILLAEGEIIKKIIDDDLFCFAAIQKCKDYMLVNKSVDICISNTLTTSLLSYQHIERESRQNYYLPWRSGKVKSFTFGDVSMLIRKSSVPYIGLYDTSFIMIDYEFALRISYLQANIAYYTGFNAMSLYNPDSVSGNVVRDKLKIEGIRANTMYEYLGDQASISLLSKVKIFIGKTLQQLGIWRPSRLANSKNTISYDDLDEIYEFCYNQLNLANTDQQFDFL